MSVYVETLKSIVSNAIPLYTVYELDENGAKNPVISFDSIQEVNIKVSTNITTYATENNIEVTDYKFITPSKIKVRGVIERETLVQSTISSIIGTGGNLISKTRTQLDKYVQGIYNLNIETKSGLYENYSLVGFEIPETFDNYNYLEVIMDFQENLFPEGRKKLLSSIADNDTVNSGLMNKIETNLL